MGATHKRRRGKGLTIQQAGLCRLEERPGRGGGWVVVAEPENDNLRSDHGGDSDD